MQKVRLVKSNHHGMRKMTVTDFRVLTKRTPQKALIVKYHRSFGRDASGKISTRHKGAGEKRKFRLINSLNNYLGQAATVEHIEYDPNRSSFIVLVKLSSGTNTYLLAWDGVKQGDVVEAKDKTEIKPGNRMRLGNIPNGIQIFDVELQPGQGGKLIKSAGSQTMITAKEGNWVHIKMPSGEVRRVNKNCFASIGQASNPSHSLVRIGKAGRKRHMGTRPTVRGKAMHPDAHPHGGGEGNNPIGLKYPKTPWGKHASGVRTRKKNKYSAKMIIKRRKR